MFTNFVHSAAREMAVREMQASQGTNFIDPRLGNSKPSYLMKKVYTVAIFVFSFFKSFKLLVEGYEGRDYTFTKNFEDITSKQKGNVKENFNSWINEYKSNRNNTATSAINNAEYLSETEKKELVAQLEEVAKMTDAGFPLKATYVSKNDAGKPVVRDIEEKDFNTNWTNFMEQLKGIIADKQHSKISSKISSKVDAKKEIAAAKASNKQGKDGVDTRTLLNKGLVAKSLDKIFGKITKEEVKKAGKNEQNVLDQLKIAKKLSVNTAQEIKTKNARIAELKQALPVAIRKDRDERVAASKSKFSVGSVRSVFEQHPKKTAAAVAGFLGLGAYYLSNPTSAVTGVAADVANATVANATVAAVAQAPAALGSLATGTAKIVVENTPVVMEQGFTWANSTVMPMFNETVVPALSTTAGFVFDASAKTAVAAGTGLAAFVGGTSKHVSNAFKNSRDADRKALAEDNNRNQNNKKRSRKRPLQKV